MKQNAKHGDRRDQNPKPSRAEDLKNCLHGSRTRSKPEDTREASERIFGDDDARRH